MTEPTMTIRFKHTNTEVDHDLEDLLTRKITALEKYLTASEIHCDAEFRKEAPHNSGSIYVVEVNIAHNGTLYRAEASKESFEQAIDEVRDELDKEIRRKHKKRSNLFLKGARRVKEMMRFGR